MNTAHFTLVVSDLKQQRQALLLKIALIDQAIAAIKRLSDSSHESDESEDINAEEEWPPH